MGARVTTPLKLPPGIRKGHGKLDTIGRWVDADKVRFNNGKVQKLGGWTKLSSALLSGIARAARAWGDHSAIGGTATAIGTHKKLYEVDYQNALQDITPYENSYALFSTFKTTNASPTVTVYHPAHGKTVGAIVALENTSQVVGGLTMDGVWTVASVPDADSYTFTHTSNATSTVSDYTGDTTAIFPDTLTNAFSTTNGSAVVTVAAPAHDRQVGEVVTFKGSSASVGGLAMDGTWTIASVPTANSLTFTHTSTATSTAGPTGTTYACFELPWGDVDPTGGYGYGIGDYGEEDWGVPRSATSLFLQPHYWTLHNFGRLLVAASFRNKIHIWDPQGDPRPRAAAVPGGPAECRGAFVTPERFIVAWGASPSANEAIDPMYLRWCSQADYSIWTPGPTNTANGRRLTEGKELMGGGPIGGGLSMIWSDTAAYPMRYTGSKYVYETELAGTNMGLAGPTAWCEARGMAFWYGSGQFWMYGAGASALPNQGDILDWLHAQIREEYLTKTVCFYNQAFNEVWWLFVTGDGTEPGVYVIFSLDDGSWTPGTLERTAAYTPGVGGDSRPRMVGADGYIYIHESGTDADGEALSAYIESGLFQIQEGGTLVQVLGYIPDFVDQAEDVSVELRAYDRAPYASFETETLTVTTDDGLVDARIRARMLSLRIAQAAENGFFAIGRPAVEIMTGAKKR